MPQLDDLVNLIQSVENVNQQLLHQNTFLKEEMSKTKSSILLLIEENSKLHNELKNVTISDIIAEFQSQKQQQHTSYINKNAHTSNTNLTLQAQLKTKE